MRTPGVTDRYVIARESNVVRVDFGREPDPPGPYFPGAGALRGWGEVDDVLEPVTAACVAVRTETRLQRAA
jgi:hypothetical protein